MNNLISYIKNRFDIKGKLLCPTCNSINMKQVDEPNGGGSICLDCQTFLRWDRKVITKEQFENNLKW